MFGWTRRYENLLAQHKAIISDLRSQLVERDQTIKDLTDKVIALASPATLREVRRVPPAPQPAQAGGDNPERSRRMHWPGTLPDLRPPSPKTPPALAPTLSDIDRVAAIVKAGEADGG